MNYEKETISRKRTSLSHFLQGIPPTLKRKRSFHSEDEPEEEQVQPPKKKKTTTTLNRVTAILQKIASVVHTSPIKRYSAKRNKRDDALTLYQDYFISLPTIEWTNGSLGIVLDTLPKEQEDSDDEESIYLEFPTPPSSSPKLFAQQIIRPTKKKRLDSCPPRFDSLITHSSSCSSNSSLLPLTPTSTTSSK